MLKRLLNRKLNVVKLKLREERRGFNEEVKQKMTRKIQFDVFKTKKIKCKAYSAMLLHL